MQCTNPTCGLHGDPFGNVSNQPVLVDFENSILEKSGFFSRVGASPIERRRIFSGIRRRVPRVNKVVERLTADMLLKLRQSSKPSRVLVVGGGAIGSGTEALYASPDVEIIGTDIYATDNTKLICDGHNLPFADSSFDAVLIQAVLEHVLSPERVVSEIHRVLRPNGLIVADTPFMQQVHEGAYDFTRFTLSGHRWLFRNFELISAGPTGGVGTSLRWSIRYFATAVTGRKRIGTLAWMLFFWLPMFDGRGRLQEDGATGVHFFGMKSDEPIRQKDIVKFYSDRISCKS